MSKRDRDEVKDAVGSKMIVEGQPRGAEGPDDMVLDGRVIGHPTGFRFATGQEKVSVGDWGLEMLRGRHRGHGKR